MTRMVSQPLDPKYAKQWDDTRTALLWHCPAFSHILYSMLNKHDHEHIAIMTDEILIAATDGSNLILNPAVFFTKYTLMERVFIVAHEIMHCVFGHVEMGQRCKSLGKVGLPNGKTLPYDHHVMNMAMDYVINAILVDSNVGKFNTDWLHDVTKGTAKDSVIDVYARIYKDEKGKGGEGKGGEGRGRFDEHLAPGTVEGKDPTQAAQDRNESEWKTQTAAAAHAARVQGKLPAGLDRALTNALNPKVDWREHIQALFARAFGSESVNWRKPERRYIVDDIYVPETSGFGAELVIVAIDTSGSIGQNELDMFFGELSGILEDVQPEMVKVIWCDAKVHRVDEITDLTDLADLRMKKAPGGGGTDFRPVFEHIEKYENKPDAIVYLTDGYGTFPTHAPNCPMIWGDIAKNPNYPFGQVVEVPRA
jgi:predicted metal-dependent peptidase